MNLTEMLTKQLDDAYRAADGLMALADDGQLEWKPGSGENWMTTGQLLFHISESCGAVTKGFVTGDWSLLGGDDGSGSGDQPNPPATMKSAASVADARARLAADKTLALEMLAAAGEDKLAHQESVAPWNPVPRALGYSIYECIEHLTSHKSQLFYYLKLQGKPVNTMHLWGMASDG